SHPVSSAYPRPFPENTRRCASPGGLHPRFIRERRMDGMVRYWVYGGFPTGLLLLALTPLIAAGWNTAIVAVFLQLPIYMLHQGEEHFGDRFRLFANDMLAGGREALTPWAVFVIN